VPASHVARGGATDDEAPMTIQYRDDFRPDAAAAIDLYRRSTLGERRPIDRPDRFARMMANATLVITAWDGAKLIGIARTLTDYSYTAYLADLAVDAAWQRRGIGRALIAATRAQLDPECTITLLSAPAANDYYARLGFEPNTSGWQLKAHQPLR
jgi:predicted N-acetyltransferase YhbS